MNGIQLLDSIPDEYLLRVEWSPEYDDVLTVLTETDIPLVKTTGTNKQWAFDIRGALEAMLPPFMHAVKR